MGVRHEGARARRGGRASEERWASGLIRTQSGVKLRLYVKCRVGEKVCEKRVPIPWLIFLIFLLFFIFFCNQIVIMFKGTKDSCSVSYGDKKPISKRHPARFTWS